MGEVYHAHDNRLRRDVAVKILPRVFTRDAERLARFWTFYIAVDGKILDVDREVTPSTHGKKVIAKLAQLGVKRRTARSR